MRVDFAPMAASSSDMQPMEVANDASESPHPLLTKLVAATRGHEAELDDQQKAMLRAEADTCIEAMRTRRDDDGWLVPKKAHSLEPEFVAAALALMCGYFRKKNGRRLVCGPNGAAAAFGRADISRATLVTDKQTQLERLEAVLQQEAAGQIELGASAAATPEGDSAIDECARKDADARERILANVIAMNVWMPRYCELGAAETYEAMLALGWHDGKAGVFCRARVEEAMVEARSQYAIILDKCRHEMWCVYHSHFLRRRPELSKKNFGDAAILNELAAKDVRGALEGNGFSFPYAMVRGEMTAVKRDYLEGFSVEEMERAYVAGPPPPLALLPPRDATDALITDMLTCRLGGQMKLTSLEQIEKDAGKPERTVVEQSRLWLEQRSYEVAYLGQTDEAPPLRPGGRARLRDWQAQPELNGLEVELCEWHDNSGLWAVRIDDGDYPLDERLAQLSNAHYDTCLKVTPAQLQPLPDSEPWHCYVACYFELHKVPFSIRFEWAERHPIQARAIGIEFDSRRRPIDFPSIPADKVGVSYIDQKLGDYHESVRRYQATRQ